MSNNLCGPPLNRAYELRSIANAIEIMFPSADDLLRGIANEIEAP